MHPLRSLQSAASATKLAMTSEPAVPATTASRGKGGDIRYQVLSADGLGPRFEPSTRATDPAVDKL